MLRRSLVRTAQEFLDVLAEGLKGLVDEDKGMLLVSEQGLWLDQRINHEVLLGKTYEEAEAFVLRRNGCPRKLANKLALESYEDEVDSPIFNLLGRANVNANSVFGLMCGLFMCYLHLRNYIPNPSPIALKMSPAEIREVFPEPLPFPDMSLQFLLTMGFALLAPVVGGWVCGRLIPVGAPRAIYNVVMIMAVASFLLGLMLLPDRGPLVFAALLAIYWLPVGCLTAHLSSSILRGQRRRVLERSELHPSSPLTFKETNSL